MSNIVKPTSFREVEEEELEYDGAGLNFKETFAVVVSAVVAVAGISLIALGRGGVQSLNVAGGITFSAGYLGVAGTFVENGFRTC